MTSIKIGTFQKQPQGFSAFIPKQFTLQNSFNFSSKIYKKNIKATRLIGKLDGTTATLSYFEMTLFILHWLEPHCNTSKTCPLIQYTKHFILSSIFTKKGSCFMNVSKFCCYGTLALRLFMGALFCFAGVSYFFMTTLPIDPATPSGKFSLALLATGYFFPFLKISEILGGALLFFKRSSALGLLILTPIILNIVMLGFFLEPSIIPMGLVLLVCLGILTKSNWKKYTHLFDA